MSIAGLLIRRERLARAWSQEGLCRGICGTSYLSKIEQGKAAASEEVLALLFARLGLSWTDDADGALHAQTVELFSPTGEVKGVRQVSARFAKPIDRNLLRILQEEGRLSFTELGERVGLSTTPCTERVRRLERDGVITGYHARVNPSSVKASLLVFVEISLAYKSGDIFEEFRRAALRLPNVLECHLVSGDFDYLIKARISEMASYRKLLGSTLLTMPNVRESKSYIVMEEVKETLSLPIPD